MNCKLCACILVYGQICALMYELQTLQAASSVPQKLPSAINTEAPDPSSGVQTTLQFCAGGITLGKPSRLVSIFFCNLHKLYIYQ